MVTEYITKEQAIAAAKRGIRISVNSFVSTKEEIEAIKAADVVERTKVFDALNKALHYKCDQWMESEAIDTMTNELWAIIELLLGNEERAIDLRSVQ